MKKLTLSAVMLTLACVAFSQVPVIYYDFELNSNRTTFENAVEQALSSGNGAFTRVSATGGTLGQASGAGRASYYGGSASGVGITSTRWPMSSADPGTGATEYFQVKVNTTGFRDLSISMDAEKINGQSPNKLGVLWSIDGITFYNATTAPLSMGGSYANLSFELPSGADNQGALTIRIYAFNSNSTNAGLSIDNVAVLAKTITGVTSLINFDAYGLSLTSGLASTPRFAGDLNISDAGTVVTLNNRLNLGGTITVGTNATFGFGSGGTLAGGGNLVLADGSTLQLSSTNTQSALKGNVGSSLLNLYPNATIEYIGTTGIQYQDAATLSNVIVNNANGVVHTSDVTVKGNVTLKKGTMSPGQNKLTIKGNIVKAQGSINANNTEVEFNGSVTQSIDAESFTGNIKKLHINNPNDVSFNGNVSVGDSLKLTAGKLKIGTNKLTINGGIAKDNQTQSGTIDAAEGTVEFAGTATQSVDAESFTGNIKKLHINNPNDVSFNGNVSVGDSLKLTAGKLKIGTNKLTINGGIAKDGLTQTGTIDATAGTVEFAGTLEQEIPANTFSNDQAKNVRVSNTHGNGVSLKGKMELTGMIDFGSVNNSKFNSNGHLVLKSTANGTAMVADMTNGGANTGNDISGDVTVERFSPAWASRRYRLITSPVMNTTINAAWQEGTRWNGNSSIASTGYGTLITGQQQGSAATANANGFDFWSAIAGGGASVRYYLGATSSSQASWQPLISTLTPNAFDNHQAYLVFIRGDRSFAAGTAAGATTLRAKGALKKGTISVNVPADKSYTLIGNPFASPIDFKQVYDANSTKIQSSFYIWQASLGTGSGGYVLVRPVSPGSSLYETIPGDGSASAENRLIHSGEGFFLRPAATATGSNAITIQEKHKSKGTPAVSVFRLKDVQVPAKLYVNLTTTANNTKTLLDGVLSQYQKDPAATSESVVLKSVNSNENVAITRKATDLIFSATAFPSGADTLKLKVWNTTTKEYQLEIRSANFAGVGMTAFLVDRFLKKETLLDMNDATTVYPFNVTTDAASKAQDRFLIVLKSAQTLPLSITELKAEESRGRGVLVSWKVADESGIHSYAVEKSANGNDFVAVETVAAKAGAGLQVYSVVDTAPLATNYYRIKMVGTGNEVKYSSVVKLQLQAGASDVSLYPNPLSGSELHLQLTNKPKGFYTVTLFHLSGQAVVKMNLQHNGGSTSTLLSVPASVSAGNYKLQIRNIAGETGMLNLAVVR